MNSFDVNSSFQLICALLLTIALTYAIARFLKGNISLMKKSGRITLKERTMLDAKNALYIVEIDGKNLLLGSSEKGITLLTEVLPYSHNQLRNNIHEHNT